LSPLAFMLSIVDDMAQPIAMRLLAARYSAPYVHSWLPEIGKLPVLISLSTEELQDWFRRNEEDALRHGVHPPPGPRLLNGGDGSANIVACARQCAPSCRGAVCGLEAGATGG
jgi:hypothetical protein